MEVPPGRVEQISDGGPEAIRELLAELRAMKFNGLLKTSVVRGETPAEGVLVLRGGDGVLAEHRSEVEVTGADAERPLLSLHLAGAAFELGLLRLMFPQEGGLAGLQVLHGRGLRIRAMAQSELSGLRRLLALLEVLLAAIQVGFPRGEVPSARVGRPDSILKRLFGAEEFRRLFLQAASGFLNLFHGPGGLASLPLTLPRLGREVALPPLELLGFPADLLLLEIGRAHV